jgi:hypothetical protein
MMEWGWAVNRGGSTSISGNGDLVDDTVSILAKPVGAVASKFSAASFPTDLKRLKALRQTTNLGVGSSNHSGRAILL